MTGLVLPKHIYAAEQRRKATLQDEAVAENISKSRVHRFDSDDFVTPQDVAFQLYKLQSYIELRRQEQADYHLPEPVGWRLQILMLTIPDKTAGGLIAPEDHAEQRALSSPQGIVLAMGSACYQDKSRFSLSGEIVPWCAIGDRIQVVRYDAQWFQIANGQRLGIVSDTQPVAVIDSNWEVPQ